MLILHQGGVGNDEFLKNNIVAIGWDLGDLSDKSDDEIRVLFQNKYKNLSEIKKLWLTKGIDLEYSTLCLILFRSSKKGTVRASP